MRVVYLVRAVQAASVLVCLAFLLGHTDICSSMDYAQFEREVRMATSHKVNGSCDVALTRYLDFYVHQPSRGIDLSDWRRGNETLQEFVNRTRRNFTMSSGGHVRQRRQVGGAEKKEEDGAQKRKYLTSCATASWRDVFADGLFPTGSPWLSVVFFFLLLVVLLSEIGYVYFFDQEYTKFGTIVLSCIHMMFSLLAAVSAFIFRSGWSKSWELGLVGTPLYPGEWLLVEVSAYLMGLVFFVELFCKQFLNGQFVFFLHSFKMASLDVRVHDNALPPSYELVPQ